MSYSYNITTSKNDKQSTLSISACHLIFGVINLFLSTFLIAHIYSLTNNIFSYAINVGIYQLSCYICMAIAYFLFSLWVDRSNRVWVYRVANIILTALVVVTIFYGKNLAKLIVLAGLLNGIAHGAYYSSYNVLKQEMVSRKSIKNFTIVITVLSKIFNVVCPILLGVLIDVSTYSMVAIYVLILSLVQIFITFFIKAKRPENSDFNVKKFLHRLKEKPELKKKVFAVYKTSFFYGIITCIASLLNISIMNNFGSNFSFGAVTSVFAFVSIFLVVTIQKCTKFGKRSWLCILVAVLIATGAIIFSVYPNKITLIVYHLCYTICDAIIAPSFEIIRNRNLKEGGFYQDIAEHQFIIEMIFCFMRIVSFGVLILVSLFKVYILFQIYFIFLVLAYTLMPISMMKLEKIKDDNEENK